MTEESSSNEKPFISIRFHSGFEFSDTQLKLYSFIGYIFSTLARFEVDLDDLIFSLAEFDIDRCLEISANAPRDFGEKSAFVIKMFKFMPDLATLRDAEGFIDIEYFSQLLEAVWVTRNDLFHGYLYLSKSNDGDIEYHFFRYKYSRADGISKLKYIYKKSRLIEFINAVAYLRAFLIDARKIIESKNS